MNNKNTQTLSEKAINWFHQIAYFTEYNKSLYKVVTEWLKIENEERINEDSKMHIDDNPVG